MSATELRAFAEAAVATQFRSDPSGIDALVAFQRRCTPEYAIALLDEIDALRRDREKLAWFFFMVKSGGPDGSDLDTLVYDEAKEIASRALSEGEQKP